jgi:hypothetical protein
MKLFELTLRGLKSCYVIAEDPTDAYNKARKWLDKEGYSFECTKELKNIELLADENGNFDFADNMPKLFL